MNLSSSFATNDNNYELGQEMNNSVSYDDDDVFTNNNNNSSVFNNNSSANDSLFNRNTHLNLSQEALTQLYIRNLIENMNNEQNAHLLGTDNNNQCRPRNTSLMNLNKSNNNNNQLSNSQLLCNNSSSMAEQNARKRITSIPPQLQNNSQNNSLLGSKLNLYGPTNSQILASSAYQPHMASNGSSSGFGNLFPPSQLNPSFFSNNSSSANSMQNSSLILSSTGKPLRSERLPSHVVDEMVRQAKLRRKNGGKKEVCVFCRNNGEKEQIYTSHTLKDAMNRVSCPILRLYECPICHGSGDNAHTIKYCPYAEKDSACMKLFKDGRMSAAALLMNSFSATTPPSTSPTPLQQQNQGLLASGNGNVSPNAFNLAQLLNYNNFANSGFGLQRNANSMSAANFLGNGASSNGNAPVSSTPKMHLNPATFKQ